MIPRASILCTIAASLLVVSSAAASSRDRVPVSPGSTASILTVDRTCPTFSWAGSDPDTPLVLEVVEIAEAGALRPLELLGTRTHVTASLPAGSSSWTLSGRQCLEPGATYAWWVHDASDAPAGGDAVRFYFRVWEGPRAGRPSMAEVDWARDVLERALAASEALEMDAPVKAAAVSHPSAGTPSVPVDQPTQRGATPPPALRVDGGLFTSELRALAIPPEFEGDIRAAALIESATGSMVSPRATLSKPSGDVYTLRATASGEVTVCRSSTSCDTSASPTATGRVRAGRLVAGQVTVEPATGSLILTGNSNQWFGSGGGGFFEVPSATNVNVDNNYSACSGSGVAVGVQLWETDNNQIGIRIRCSR